MPLLHIQLPVVIPTYSTVQFNQNPRHKSKFVHQHPNVSQVESRRLRAVYSFSVGLVHIIEFRIENVHLTAASVSTFFLSLLLQYFSNPATPHYKSHTSCSRNLFAFYSTNRFDSASRTTELTLTE